MNSATDCYQFYAVEILFFQLMKRFMNEFRIKINVSQIFCQLTYIRRI